MARTKDWTILVSVVARPFETGGNAHRHYMNTKADEVRVALENAVEDLDIYVAYDVIYDPSDADPTGHNYQNQEPAARVLNADPDDSREMSKVGWFNNGHESREQLDPGTALQNNLLGFYAWALSRCPARHYAVFFWGHSYGPAGLFELRAAPFVPAVTAPEPSLTSIKELSLWTVRLHDVAQVRTVLRRMRVGLYATDSQYEELLNRMVNSNPEDVLRKPGTAEDVKVDVVFFQDCWMSTLETAFEINDAARFVVASQSLVPFGYPSVPTCGLKPDPPGRGVWPYRALFQRLIAFSSTQAGLEGLIETLGSYYDADQASEIWPNASLPFALLNLDQINDELIQSLQMLIVAINRLRRTGAIDLAFVEGASIAVSGPSACADRPTTNELAAGSIALVDLRVLCQRLCMEDLLDDERHAAEKLRDSNLVMSLHESTSPNLPVFRPESEKGPGTPLGASLNFRGISFFYYPTEARRKSWAGQDEHIFPEVGATTDAYRDLRLSRDVGRLGTNVDSVEWPRFVLENL